MNINEQLSDQWMQQQPYPGLLFQSQSKQASVVYEIGRAACGSVREFLASEKFRGLKIEWLESKGWISRTFTIKGEAADVQRVVAAIDAWAADLARAANGHSLA